MLYCNEKCIIKPIQPIEIKQYPNIIIILNGLEFGIIN